MDCEWAFVCDFAEQDRKLHAVGIAWDILYAPQLPTVHASMTFVAHIRGTVAERGTKPIVLRLIDEDGEDVAVMAQTIPFEVRPGQLSAAANVIATFHMTEFKKYGQYAFHLLVQDVELKQVNFVLSQPPPTTG